MVLTDPSRYKFGELWELDFSYFIEGGGWFPDCSTRSCDILVIINETHDPKLFICGDQTSS